MSSIGHAPADWRVQVPRPVKRNNRLSCARGAGDPCRAIEILLHKLSLLRMEEHRPTFPRVVERQSKFFDILHHAEAAQCVWVFKRITTRSNRHWQRWPDASGKIQECFGGLCRQMAGDLQQTVFARIQNLGHPFGRNTIRKERAFRDIVEDPLFGLGLHSLNILWTAIS